MIRFTRVFAFIVFVFLGFRLAIYLHYFKQYFDQLSLIEVCESFFAGIRFDVSVAFTFLGFPVLLAEIPFKFLPAAWRCFWYWFAFMTLVLLSLFLAGDHVYFSQVGRHLFDELVILNNDWRFVAELAFGEYFFILIGLFAVWFLAAITWYRLIIYKFGKVMSWSTFVALLLFLFIGVRGSFGKKPLSIVDGYISPNFAQSQLVLNGAFTAWHSSISSKAFEVRVDLSDAEIRGRLANMGVKGEEGFPFYDRVAPSPFKKPNVILFVLESWSSFYVDSYGGNNFGATPEFDKLVKFGVQYTNFFASGTRSIEAIQSILTGVPAMQGVPTLGQGLELLNISKLGVIAKESGYQTLFFQSAPRESFHMNIIARALGFDFYYGFEDYPKILDYGNEGDPHFGWDYETFDFVKGKLGEGPQPFFAVVFSGTTHTPFRKTPNIRDLSGHGSDNEAGFLNTLRYADDSLGSFMAGARGTSWISNTIFLFTADHTLRTYRDFEGLEKFRVPFLLYAPDLLEPAVVAAYASHNDLMPTIVSLFGFSGRVSSAGRNLFLPASREQAFISGRYEPPGMVTKEYYLRHNFIDRVEGISFRDDCDDHCLDEGEKDLLSLSYSILSAIRKNTWLPQ